MRRDDGPIQIGLKYCGGCRSGYDRAALVREIAVRLAGKAVLVRPENGGFDLAVVICGCPTACADLSVLGDATIWMIRCPNDAEAFISHVKGEAMMLSREQIASALKDWNRAWARFDLEGVMALMHDDVLFENWTGGTAAGKDALREAWRNWFAGGGFRFIEEDLFIDETEQKVLFRWLLEWPCPDAAFRGETEKRRGVDVMHFKEGKIILKLTYSKTTVEIGGRRQALHF